MGAHCTTTGPALEFFANEPGILYYEADTIQTGTETLPNDPRFAQQFGLHNTGQSDGAVDAITPALGRLMSKREFPGGERSALSVRWDANVQDDDEDFVVARECKRRDECKATPTAIRTLKAAGGGGARIIYSAAGLDHLTGDQFEITQFLKNLRIEVLGFRQVFGHLSAQTAFS